jgi:hypothetical protein
MAVLDLRGQWAALTPAKRRKLGSGNWGQSALPLLTFGDLTAEQARRGSQSGPQWHTDEYSVATYAGWSESIF